MQCQPGDCAWTREFLSSSIAQYQGLPLSVLHIPGISPLHISPDCVKSGLIAHETATCQRAHTQRTSCFCGVTNNFPYRCGARPARASWQRRSRGTGCGRPHGRLCPSSGRAPSKSRPHPVASCRRFRPQLPSRCSRHVDLPRSLANL